MGRLLCFFFNDTATTEIYTLSLHDALPILAGESAGAGSNALPHLPGEGADHQRRARVGPGGIRSSVCEDRKSTRLNSSHANISYAVFCLKKKNYILTSTFRNYLIDPSLLST